MVRLSFRSFEDSYSGHLDTCTDFLLPAISHNSSAMCGANGARSCRKIFHWFFPTLPCFSTALRKIMSVLIAVLNFSAAISSPTFLMVLCKRDSIFGFRKLEFAVLCPVLQTRSRKRRIPTTPSGFHGELETSLYGPINA